MHKYGPIGQPQLTASPPEINLGFTSQLIVNCTFNKSSHVNLISLFLSRATSPYLHHFQDVATVNVYAPDTVHVLSAGDHGVTASGKVTAGVGPSYLGLAWASPSLDDACLYRCTAQGVDSTGHNTVVNEVLEVTSRQPTMGEMVSKIVELNAQLKQMSDKFAQLQSKVLDMPGCCAGKRSRRESIKSENSEQRN